MVLSSTPYPPPPPREDELVFDDGVPMESERHRMQMQLLIEVLRGHLASERQDAYVGGNMAFYFSETQARRTDFRAPDVLVCLGVPDRERKGWVVWFEDGKVPDLIIELLSESTASQDRGEKRSAYERLKVSEYLRYDPFGGALEADRWDEGRYLRVAAGGDGRVVSSVLGGAWFGPWDGSYDGRDGPWLRLFGADGCLVPTRAEAEAARADAEAARAEAEAARAAELELRLAAYQAQLGPPSR